MEADGLYDVLAVSQDVVCDSPGKQRVTLEYGQAVPYFMKLVGWEQLVAQGVPRWQVHKRVAGGSQRRGSVASPV